MAAPKGNRNARKGKDWEGALRRALSQYELVGADGKPVVPKGEALHAIARRVVELAILGSKDAITEIANRLDGKPTEYVEGSILHTYAGTLSDDELADIATGSRARAAEPESGEAISPELH